MDTNDGGKILVDKEVAQLADDYIDFILSLGFLKKLLDAGADEQKVCFEVLAVTKRFIDLNPVAYAVGISQPFGLLAAGINDVWAGKKPKLFTRNPETQPKAKPGQTFNAVKAVAAAALDLRVYYGAELQIAASEIARELKNVGIEYTGSTPIVWQTVKGWRDEMGGRNHPMANDIFKEIISQARSYFGDKADLARIKKHTGQYLLAAAHAGAFVAVKSETGASQSD